MASSGPVFRRLTRLIRADFAGEGGTSSDTNTDGSRLAAHATPSLSTNREGLLTRVGRVKAGCARSLQPIPQRGTEREASATRKPQKTHSSWHFAIGGNGHFLRSEVLRWGRGLVPVPRCHSGNAGRGSSITTVVSSFTCDPVVPVARNGDPAGFVRRVPSMRPTRGRRQCRLPLSLLARETNRFGHLRGGCHRC